MSAKYRYKLIVKTINVKAAYYPEMVALGFTVTDSAYYTTVFVLLIAFFEVFQAKFCLAASLFKTAKCWLPNLTPWRLFNMILLLSFVHL